MGVELRSIQRKFHTLMNEVKPQIRPRFVVWLDERLAEFKCKGRMELSETLDDPRWIKDYYTSKRESKAAAIKDREARDAGLTTASSLVQPKLEQKSEKSESSNGIAHPEELGLMGEADNEEKHEEDASAALQTQKDESPVDKREHEPAFQLVEVKSEQMEDDDDDMIIVGESIAPPMKHPQYNPLRNIYSGFQRKRQRFGSMPHRPFKSSRFKPNFRSASTATSSQPSFPSHSATSRSPYTSTPSSQPSFHSQSYVDETQSYEEESPSFTAASQSFPSELIRLPPHLQAEAAALQSQEQIDYQVTEGDMYDEYDDESYDSSFLTEGESIVYDEEGNAMLKGDDGGENSSMDPAAGTSDAASSQGMHPSPRLHLYLACEICHKTFGSRFTYKRHMNYLHYNQFKHVCSFCQKTFQTKENMEGHVNRNHLDIRPYACRCGKSFCYKSHLQKHGKLCTLYAL